ncbi:hypothetical protein B0919_07435 [Hymenobacter sp. CRA2]|nr:hypothetical protein B0919_07435 [Hymenobacter sp. CRA2]
MLGAAVAGLVACQSTQQEAEHPANSEATNNASSPQALAQRFAPFMNGNWVSAEYLDALARTKSPYEASDLLMGVPELSINLNAAVGDSVPVPASLNNHEGYPMGLFLRPAIKANALPTNHFDPDKTGSFYEFSYRITGPDTFLVLNHYDQRKRLLDAVRYRRVLRNNQRMREMDLIEYAVNRQLFAGRYAATDSAGRTSNVQLTTDGRITGLGPWRWYQPTTDFVVILANDVDNLQISTKPNASGSTMTFRVSGDTLRLYAAKVVETPKPELVQGKLHYTLVRQR